MGNDALRRLPAVNSLLDDPALRAVIDELGREAVLRAVRAVLAGERDAIRAGGGTTDPAALAARVRARLAERPTLYRACLNATGVLLHTNLGRAPLPAAAWDAMAEAAGYCDLEVDLVTGKRASRLRGVEEPLCAVTGAEAGMVVNNNAAAVLLALTALAGERPTAISRGHLVEIGGGFRLPTIMEASGSPLMELGTTNRTHLRDYGAALDAGAGLVLLVHRSNFVMSGYVTEPGDAEVIELCRARGVPVVLDLGSGALVDTTAHALPRETTVPEAVQAGFDLVCFSGDKLLGGPQAGYLVGRRAVVDALRKHPLARALRCDKLQLAACVATLELYRRGEAERQVPLWRMLAEDTRARAEAWRAALGAPSSVSVVDAAGAVGGGSLPEGTVPGAALAVKVDDPDALVRALRQQSPPIVAHIDHDRVLLHPRTVDPARDDDLVRGLAAALVAVGAPSPGETLTGPRA